MCLGLGMSVAGGWGDLPWELLLLITQHLEMADVIRLRAVCYHWAWAFGKTCGRIHPTLHDPFLQCHSSPWLLLPKASGKVADSCTFLSLFEDRFYTIPSLPQIVDRRIVGSSPDGWVVTVDRLFTPRLFNPLTRQELSLPSLSTLHRKLVPIYSEHDGSLSAVLYTGFDTTFPIDTITETFCDYYLTKIILTSSPFEGGFAVAICTFPNQESFLASAVPGDEAWSPVFEFNKLDDFGMLDVTQMLETIDDVSCDKRARCLYVLTDWPAVVILERINGLWDMAAMVTTQGIRLEIGYWRRYIIFSCGEILQITRYLEQEADGESSGGSNCKLISKAFKISKLDIIKHDLHNELILCPDDSCWVPVDSLGDRSLFLGYNGSFFMNCGHDKIGPQRNKIYFADNNDFKELGRITISDAGVYDMESKTIESLCPSDCRHSVWYTPTQSLWE